MVSLSEALRQGDQGWQQKQWSAKRACRQPYSCACHAILCPFKMPSHAFWLHRMPSHPFRLQQMPPHHA